MQQLQISRGKLDIRLNNKELLPGELFLDYTHGVKYDEENKTYELYAGCNGENIKIGGQGVLSFIREIESLPSDPIQGGIYYVTKNINLKSNSSSTGQDIPEFREGDLAIYVGEELVHYANPLNHDVHGTNFRGNGTFPENAPGWIRVNNGGGAAYEVTFDPTNTNFNENTKTVQEALVELDRNKLAYGGVKFKSGSTDENVINPDGLANNTITVEELFDGYVKPGYYYSVGTLPPNTRLTVQISEDNFITLEEGDFLAVTSDVTSNGSPLNATDLKFEKIAGGTHDSAKINYTAGPRNESFENSSDSDTWTTSDGNIKNVAEALDQLFNTKADLNNKGKIPLTQLPDTLINSMEYVGTYTFSGEDKDPENFTLPTSADKIAHSDEATSGDEGTKLVQGDYFIYTGKQINIKNINDSAVKNNIESADGFINSGDWLVYNGNDKWSVIDNTSPIQSIKVIDSYSENGDDTINQDTIKTVIGEVQFQGSKRVVDENGSSTEISETQLEADNKETVTIHNKNSALISDDNQASLGYFYKENGNKTLIKTGISENNDTLKIEEANGLLLTGATGVKGTVHIVQNDQPDEQDLEIKLPNHSGTLATLDDTGIVDGQDFYIPMYRMGEDEEITLENSPIELIEHSGNDYDLKGFKFHSGINSTGTNGSDHNVIFKTVDGDNELVHIMPGTSGYILNSNSIIDCGEWTDDGLVFEHQGDCDTIAGILDGNTDLGKTTGTPYKDALKSTIFDGITEQEIIDAYITNA